MNDTNIPGNETNDKKEDSIEVVPVDNLEDSVNTESSSMSEGTNNETNNEAANEATGTATNEATDETTGTVANEADNAATNEPNQNTAKKLPKSDLIRYVIMGVSLVVFIVSVSMLIYYITQYGKSQKIYNDLNEEVLETTENNTTEFVDEDNKEYSFEITNTIDFEYLKSINPDSVAWISFPVLGIEYPIVQCDDNNYYLTHSYNNVETWSGSIYMDYRNTPDCSDRNTIIYGHNMQDGSMFNKLLKYDKESFYKKNEGKNIFYIYLEGGVNVYEIYAVVDAEVSKNQIPFSLKSLDKYSVEEYEAEIDSLQTYDTGVKLNADDKLATLLTCQYDSTSSVRHLVIGRYITTLDY